MKKKIFISSVLAEGLYKSRYELITEFLNLGYEVILAAPEEYHKKINGFFKNQSIKYYSIPLERTGISILNDIKLVLKLNKILKKEQPNLTYAFGGAKAAIYTTISSKLVGVEKNFCMINGLGSIFRGNGIKNKIIKIIMSILFKISLSQSDGVLFQNKDDLNEFLKLKLVKESKTKIVNGSGVNLEKYRYYMPHNNPEIFLFVGRLLKDKGIYEFIEAAKIIKKKYTEIEFWILGEVDDNPTSLSKSEIEEWEEKQVIKYFGRQENILKFYQNSSVFVLPSYHEGTPRTTLEAMAVGRPIITTDAPGCRETVLEGENGFKVPIKNIDELSSKMEYLINRPNEVIRMGNNSRKIAEQKYDVNKVNKEIISFFGLTR